MNVAPSQRAIPYLLFLQRMVEAAPAIQFTVDGVLFEPLTTLNTSEDHDFSLAVLSGWAMVAHVLSFYNERFVAEAYRETARELSSLLYLANTVGYRRNPGCSAQTWLALTVFDLPGRPDVVTADSGTALAIQNVPKQGDLPVIFEASTGFEARGTWNSFLPLQTTRAVQQRLYRGACSLRLQGVSLPLRASSPLLFGDGITRYFRTLQTVTADRISGSTTVTWTGGLGPALKLPFTECLTFRRQASLFASRAVPWSSAPDNIKEAYGTPVGGVLQAPISNPLWTSLQQGLPENIIHALLCLPSGALLAATSGGLYSWQKADSAGSWRLLPTSPAQLNACSLTRDNRGFVYLGATRGNVSYSTDYGESWQPLPTKFSPAPQKSVPQAVKPRKAWSARSMVDTVPETKTRPWWKKVFAWFKRFWPSSTVEVTPKPCPPCAGDEPFRSVVRALAAGVMDGDRFVFAGTDQGVFRLREGALLWEPMNEGLGSPDPQSGLTGVVVHALLLNGDGSLYAGTSAGLFYKTPSKAWEPQTFSSPEPVVYALAAWKEIVFAGTSNGICRLNASFFWEHLTFGLPSPLSVRAIASFGDLLFAATDRGLFQSSDGGDTWTGLTQQTKKLFRVDHSFAAKLDENVIPELLIRIFSANGSPLPPGAEITVVRKGAAWMIADYLLSRQQDDLISVSQIVTVDTDMQAVVADASQVYAATAPAGIFLESEWPDFDLVGGVIALDRVIDNITPGSVMLLTQNAPDALAITGVVLSAESQPWQAYGRQTTVTVLTIPTDPRLSLLRPRDTTVYVKSLPIQPYISESPQFAPLQGDEFVVQGAISGLRKGQGLAVTGRRARALLHTRPSVFAVSPGRSQLRSLLHQETRAFVITKDSLYVATADEGILQASVSSLGAFTGLNRGLPSTGHLDPRCLATSGKGLWLGTGVLGVFSYDGIEWISCGLPLGSPVQALAVSRSGTLYAASATEGVSRLEDDGFTWGPLCAGLDSRCVNALLAAPDGSIVAGTPEGVYFLAPGESRWMSRSSANPKGILCLAYRGNDLFAGDLNGRAWVYTDGIWKALKPTGISAYVAPLPLQALAFNASGDLYAATAGNGLLRWSDEAGWSSVLASAANDIASLLFTPSNDLVAASRSGSILLQRSGEGLPINNIWLFSTASFAPGDLDMEFVSPVLSDVFKNHGEPLRTPRLTLLRQGSLWLLVDGDSQYLLCAKDSRLRVDKVPFAQVLSITPKGGQQETQQWTLLLNGSSEVRIDAREGDLLVVASTPACSTVAEVAFLESSTPSIHRQSTICTLRQALKNVYDPATVSIAGNLVFATHGATAPAETLGSGNTAEVFQQFTLGRPPLTYARTSPEGGIETSLHVQVAAPQVRNVPDYNLEAAPPGGGEDTSQARTSAVLTTGVQPLGRATAKTPIQPWLEVPTLFGAGSSADVYMVNHDASNVPVLTFGDGTEGARLPSGTGNVVAEYRTGLGLQGNVAAGSLTVFRQRPLGLRNVTNPVPAIGGSPPESLASVRRRMSIGLSSLGRIVSVRDYADFALAIPGVLKAQSLAVPFRETQPRTVVLGIAARSTFGSPVSIEQMPVLLHSLKESILAARGRPDDLAIVGYETVPFCIEATVLLSPGSPKDKIIRSVRRALQNAFSFDNTAFGQAIYASTALSVMQQVEGVVAVTVTAFYRLGEPRSLAAKLEARPLSSAAGVLPELLLLDHQMDVTLRMEFPS